MEPWSRTGGALAALVVVLGGCSGHELVDVSVAPAGAAAPAGPVVPTAPACHAALTNETGIHEGVLSWPGTWPGNLAVACDEAARAALRRTAIFAAEPVRAVPGGPAAALVEARFDAALLSVPVIKTGLRNAAEALAWTILPIPFLFMWTEREPDLALRCTLEVGVRGERPLWRGEVVARGTVSAQLPYDSEVVDAHVPTLASLGAETLAARLAADAEARARLARALSEEPTLDALLVADETYVPRARWRTGRLVAFRNDRLEPLVAEASTSELRALLTRLQSHILDLAHAAQLSKDEAERAVAGGPRGQPAGAEGEAPAAQARAMSLTYLERVEVLRAIVAAVQEELAARSR